VTIPLKDAEAMRVASLSDTGLLIEVDLQELRILSTAMNTVCNGHILDDLEERLTGTRDTAESLLISIRALCSIFDRLRLMEPPEAAPEDAVESLPTTQASLL
jgi:hypothetical protein